MKIVILDKSTVTTGDISFSLFEGMGNVRIYDPVPNDMVADYIGDAEAVICNKAEITKEVIDKCGNLKYVGLFATGYNNVDLKAAKERNIVVCNAPGYSTPSVSQHVFALILYFSQKVNEYALSVERGDWINCPQFTYFPYPITELSGKTLGIYGLGTIGSSVAKIAKAFSMRVIFYNRSPKVCEYEAVSKEELFRRSDFLTLHCPLNEETKGLICQKNLSLMKKSAILINTSRGGVVNEADLAQALNKGIIAGAGLDVLSSEPMKKDNPLRNAKNCIITPHVAWASYEARKRLVELAFSNLQAFINNNPVNVVN